MGTPEFARVSLQALHQAGYPIVGVFAQPDKPAGRGKILTAPPCAVFATEAGLPLFQPKTLKDEAVIAQIRSLQPDYIVVVAYGKILPPAILEAPAEETLNVHASLLPRWRGAAPINHALLAGDTKTGVCLMRITPPLDAGPVFAQKELEILPEDNTETLTQKLSVLGAQLLIETLPHLKSLQPVEQDQSQVTLAPPMQKEDGHIDWNESADKIVNRVRGFNPWPVAYTFVDKQRVKIYSARVAPGSAPQKPGTIVLLGSAGLHVACGKGLILLTEVQLEGKKRMPAADFARGLRLVEGKFFE